LLPRSLAPSLTAFAFTNLENKSSAFNGLEKLIRDRTPENKPLNPKEGVGGG
jgi:hypothetical protein